MSKPITVSCPFCGSAFPANTLWRHARSRHGDTPGWETSLARATVVARLERYATRASTGCWEWTGHTNTNGYGQLSVAGRLQLVHRVSYELFVGLIPDGLCLDHLCRNALCLNPEHLEPVTWRENTLRGDAAKRLDKTHCPQGHEYAGENVLVSSTGSTQCRICTRASQRRYRQRQKERVR